MTELIPWLVVAVGVAMLVIQFNLGRLLDEPKHYNQATESLLAEIRERPAGGGGA